MSYSFSARGATKQEAKDAAAAEFDKVVASQPIHAVDRAPALAAVGAFVDMLADSPKAIYVSVSGSLGWQGEDQKIIRASVSAHAGHVDD
jgi:hypothetical protein